MSTSNTPEKMDRPPAPLAAPAQGETPRTDAEAVDLSYRGNCDLEACYVPVPFARTLERELNEAKREAASTTATALFEIRTLRQQLAQVEKERDEAREQWRMSRVCRELQAKLTVAESELAALRIDRERATEAMRNAERYLVEHGCSHEYPVLINLRAAIDAAMKQEGSK